MYEIKRGTYLDKLARYVDAPVVVAVVGLRRVGKSVLLRQLARLLRDRGRVVYVDMEEIAFEWIRDARDLAAHVAEHRAAGPTYVIVDEVQNIREWERAVASLQNRNQTHVVVSGSNSTLFAGELATRLAGRYVTIRVLPLSLREFGELYTATQRDTPAPADLFERYRALGGLPGLLHTDLSSDLVRQMLRDVYSTITLRDVVQRRSIRDLDMFESIVRLAMDNVGNLTSGKRISDYLRSQQRRGTADTVLNHLSYLCDAFVLDKVDRFDVRGKRHLQIGSKYYLGDLGLRRGLLGLQERWVAGDLENLVFHELLRRGYQVAVGVVGNREIDFVAEGANGRVYVQVSYLIGAPETLEREKSSLLRTGDAHAKVILSMDPIAPGPLDGIRHINLVDFLWGAALPTDDGT